MSSFGPDPFVPGHHYPLELTHCGLSEARRPCSEATAKSGRQRQPDQHFR